MRKEKKHLFLGLKKRLRYFFRVRIGWCTEPVKKCWGRQALGLRLAPKLVKGTRCWASQRY